MARFLLPWLGLGSAVLFGFACGAEPKDGDPSGSGHAGGAGGGSGGCAPGQIADSEGTCQDVGLRGCAAAFVEDDGVCRPTLAKCDKGTIPKFSEGCVPVGIPNCPAVFLEDDGLCHPSMAKCSEGTFAVPQKGCVSIDGPEGCGKGTWGNIPDGPKNVYVDASYAGGGSNGEKTKPFVTIAEALAVVEAGGRIAIAAGRYTEAVTLEKSSEVAGRCASLVTIDGNDGDPDVPTVVWSTDGAVTVRGVRISGDGLGVLANVDTFLDGVVIDGAAGLGISVWNGATLTIENTLVTGTRAFDREGEYVYIGGGVHVEDKAKATIRHSAFFQNREYGIRVETKGHLDAEDALVEESLPDEKYGFFGTGLEIIRASANLAAFASVRNRVSGLELNESTVVAKEILIDEVLDQPQEPLPQNGEGIPVYFGSTLELTRGVVSKTNGAGIRVDDNGSRATITETLIVDNLGKYVDLGFPLAVMPGASVTINDSAIARGRSTGLYVLSIPDWTYDPTSLTVKNLLIEDIRPDPKIDQDGEGLVVLGGDAVANVAGLFVTHAHVAAVLVDDEAKVSLSQSLLANTLTGKAVIDYPKLAENIADGIVATTRSAVKIDRTRVEGCSRAGLLFESSHGSVHLSAATRNKFGLVLDGTPTPTVDEQSLFDGNTGEGMVSDAKIPVPRAQAILPK